MTAAVPNRPTRDARRVALLDRMADHLIAHGLARSPLRALAAAAGTSDRMLLYYFTDRDRLLAALLEHVATRMTDLLADDGGRRPWATLLGELWTRTRAPALRPYLQLFFELAAAAGRDEQPHRAAAGGIATGFIAWIAERLDPEDAAAATLLLATLDGVLLLEGTGRAIEAEAALMLAVGGGTGALSYRQSG